MFQVYFSSKDYYTIDWEYFEWSECDCCDYESQEFEVMPCHITDKVMTCTLSVQDFTNMPGFTVQALFQACVDLAQDLELEKIVYIHDRYSAASLQLAALLDKSSAVKVTKEFYNEAEFFWAETVHYIYYV